MTRALRGSNLPRALCCLGLGGLFLAACTPRERATPVVAASIPPLASVAEFLVKGRYPVVSLLPSGRNPHDYEPTPTEIARARGAILFLYVHPNIDGWMLRAAKGVMGEEAPLVGMDEIPIAAGRDPHLWLDLEVMEAFVPRLAEELAAVDPSGADSYREQSRAFLDSLSRIDEDARALLQPVAHTPFALQHPGFDALARRYRLNLVAVLERHADGEASPHTLGDAVWRLAAEDARVVFAEPQLSTRTSQAIAAEVNARVAVLDPLGGEHVPGRETYFNLLRWNVHQLAVNLR